MITRKLVEQRNKEQVQLLDRNIISGQRKGQGGYLEGLSDVQGSIKLTNKRQSWLGITSTPDVANGGETDDSPQCQVRNRRGTCC